MLGDRHKLRLLYLALCGLQLTITAMGLAVAYQIQKSYSQNIDYEQSINGLRRNLAELETLARLASPDSLDLDDAGDSEVSQVTYASQTFLRKAQALLDESKRPQSPMAQSRADVESLISTMGEAATESESAGEAVSKGDKALFRARLTYVSRAVARVQVELGNINENMARARDSALLQEAEEAHRARFVLRPLAIIGVLLVLPALLYARSLNRKMSAYESELENEKVLLKRTNDELEARVLGRTMDLAQANESLRTKIAEQELTEAALKTAKEGAEAASRAKSDFLANMSHEIRTPLNGIMGMTDLALDTSVTAEQREYLETVKNSSESLLTVINDILDFSKIEARKIDLETIDFDLRECLDSTLKTLALRADEKGIELLCDVAAEVPEMVRGDSGRLRQILVNLVGNAIKFTNEGEVALRTRVQTHEGEDCILHFTVSDTGIGVAPDKHGNIFDPFAQADTSTTRKYGGTGLGLTICSRLVAMMGGMIWLESEVGRGSQFHFTVRMGAVDASSLACERITPVEILRDVKVLVVDDNRTNRRILEGMLRRWEMVPTMAESGDAALAELLAARAQGKPFTLILTDMHMPHMDGFRLVEKIRQQDEFSTTTIMMLTSAGYHGDASRCQQLGVAAYLLKPVRQLELRDAITRVMGALQQKETIPLVTRHSVRDAREFTGFLRVLLAEDNPVNQRLALRLLEKRGHRVVVAANGREALVALEREPFDLVLMDVQMPEMDGLEATVAIRERERGTGHHQPVVALTAHAMKGDRERCLAVGMDDYLTKPIRVQDLDDLLDKYLQHPPEVTELPAQMTAAMSS